MRAQKFIKPLFLILALLTGAGSATGNDIMGADMTYRCLGNDSFEFTTIVYKDCNANWQIPGGVYNLQVSANGCTMTPFSVSPQLVSCIDITPICNGYCTKCNSTCNSSTANGSCNFPYGIEKLTFKAIVYLGNTSCCNFHIGYIGNSTRNTATTTCCNSDLFYTYVELNKCVTPCNSSPIFTNDPVGILCAGQDFVFNNGALDTLDGDSLSFELAPALKAKNSQATYFGNWTYNLPLTFLGFPNKGANLPAGFHLNPTTGDMAFRPNVANQIAVIVVKVKEWRKVNGTWVVIGETRRDMQFIVMSCPNNNVPEIDPPTTFYACVGQQICVDIVTDDADQNDTVLISWNQGISGATFTNSNGQKRLADGKVCWTPKEEHVSNIPYTFTIRATDNACPVRGQSIRSFSIFVRETPEVSVGHTLLSCGRVALRYTPDKTYPGFTATWVIRDENDNPVYSSSNKQYDTAFLQPGKYSANLLFNTSTPCYNVATDSFEIVDFVTVRLPGDTAVCPDDSIFLDALTQGGQSPYQFQWWELREDDPLDLGQNEDRWVKPDSTRTYRIEVLDATGCRNYDEIRVVYSDPPPVDLGPDIRICRGEVTVLDAGIDHVNRRYYWFNGDTNRTLEAKHDFNYWVRVTDSLGCVNYDTVNQDLLSFNLSAGPDISICQGDTAKITGSGADSYQWFNLAGFSTNPLPTPISQNQQLTAVINQSRGFILRGTKTFDTITCYWMDTVYVTMDPAPQIALGAVGPFCPDDPAFNLMQAVQLPTLTNGTWTSLSAPASVVNNQFLPHLATLGGQTLRYSVMDNKGCSNRKNVAVNMLPAPTVVLKDSIVLCANEAGLELNAFKITPVNYTNVSITWYEADNNAQFMSLLDHTNPQNTILRLNQQLPPGTYKVVLRLENNGNGCGATDTGLLILRSVPQPEAGNLDPLCWDAPEVNLNLETGRSPAGGTWSSQAPILPGDRFFPADIGIDKQFTGGQYWMKYSYSLGSCTGTDSFLLEVKPLPELQMDAEEFCMDEGTISLSTYSQPAGPGSVWTGAGITGDQLDLNAAGQGTHSIHYHYTAPNGCENEIEADWYIEIPPELSIDVPVEICEGERIELSATLSNTPDMRWWTSGDGLFEGQNAQSDRVNTYYEPGLTDIATGSVIIHAQTRQASVCPEKTEQAQVIIHPLPEISILADPLEYCEPLHLEAEANSTAAPGSTYVWDFGDGQQSSGTDLQSVQHSYLANGVYQLTLTVRTDAANGNCTVQAQPQLVTVHPRPQAIPDASTWISSSNFTGIQFIDRSVIDAPGYIDEWEWTFGDPLNGSSTDPNPYYVFELVDPHDSNFYLVRLRVSSDEGCWDTASRQLLIIPELSVFIPNAFTPNGRGPGANNRFVIVAENYQSIRVSVFNRWGERVFYSESLNAQWDGTYRGYPVQQDVYLYMVEVESIHGKVYRYSGTVTLLQ